MDLRKLKDKAQKLFDQRSYFKAAEAYGQACEAAPEDLALKQRWATALRRSGQDAKAFKVLREVAAVFAKNGTCSARSP